MKAAKARAETGFDAISWADDVGTAYRYGRPVGQIGRNACIDPRCYCAWGHEVIYWGEWPSVWAERFLERVGRVRG